MHPNPAFRKENRDRNIAFARARGFGVLAVNADPAPLLSHVPFALDDGAEMVDFHLVRSNPILRLLDEPRAAVIAVQGPDSYVSPDWYGVEDQVPTWNYVAVHLRGRIERLPDEALLPMLDHLSEVFEDRLLPKTPWKTDKMTPDVLDRMLRMIAPCRMTIETVDGTWKLSQNKTDAVRMAAAERLERDGLGQEIAALAELMRGVTPS